MSRRVSRWDKKTSKVYQDAEYRRNRKRVLERDLGMCIRCFTLYGYMTFKVQCDHYKHVKSGEKPDHSMNNLWLLCESCHSIKTAQEANGKASLLKPFGDYDRDTDGWNVNVNWQSVIANRNEMFGFR